MICFSLGNSFASPQPSSLDLGALMPNAQVKNSKLVDDTYEQITFEGLYKLAWGLGAYSAENSDDLNTYLMITECTLFDKYFQNEFEWEKIKVATKSFLRINKNNVSKYYEYVQPIYLGRYDYALQGFPLIDFVNFKAQKNFQFANYILGNKACEKYTLDISKYPRAAVLTIKSPITLSFIRVPLNLAQRYIDWRAEQGLYDDDKRLAYIRYRFRVDGYNEIKLYNGIKSFNFKGKMMRLDVFADQGMFLPLYSQPY